MKNLLADTHTLKRSNNFFVCPCLSIHSAPAYPFTYSTVYVLYILSLSHILIIWFFLSGSGWNALLLRLVLISAFHPKNGSSNCIGFACTSLIFFFSNIFSFHFFCFPRDIKTVNLTNTHVILRSGSRWENTSDRNAP